MTTVNTVVSVMLLLFATSTVLLLAFGFLTASAQNSSSVSMPAEHRDSLESHCTECHNADKQKGKALDSVRGKLFAPIVK